MPKIVKITTFPSLLDVIMPHSCRGCGALGSVLCERCKKHNNFYDARVDAKMRNEKDFAEAYAVGVRTGLLAGLIHEYKYNSVRAAGKVLAELLAEKLPEIPGAVIVPVPTSTKHVRERGFDHTLKLAKRVARAKNWEVQRILTREKNTVQVGADKKTREKQAAEAFSVNPKAKIDKNRTYVVLDDVWTTGASMKAAVKKIRAAGAEEIIVALLAVNNVD